MNVRKPAPKSQQPESFEFNQDNLQLAKDHIRKYPLSRQASAVLPLLHLVQKQHNNWVPMAAIEYVAKLLDMAPMRVFEVVSFYTMFNLAPVGKHHIQLCGTTPCWLSGSDSIKSACQERLGIDLNQVTSDGMFSLSEVECLGACANAPVVQINDDYYEDLTSESMLSILNCLESGKTIRTGSQKGRKTSEPK
jgi:NADH-quinone oxidoreductase subunit E